MLQAPELTSLSLGPIEIQVWGTLVGLGFLVGYFLALHRANKLGLAKNHLQNLALIILVLSVVGSRLMYLVLFPAEFKSIFDVLSIDHGGMAFFGGFLLALAGSFIYCRLRKISFALLVDCIAPALALGYGIGRVGCFLTDFHPGIPTSLPWGFEYEGVVRHPTALYSSLVGFLIFGILLWVEKYMTKRPLGSNQKNTLTLGVGMIGMLFVLLFSTYRFLIDFLRADDLGFDPRFFGLTYAQIISLVLLFGALIIVLRKRSSGSRA